VNRRELIGLVAGAAASSVIPKESRAKPPHSTAPSDVQFIDSRTEKGAYQKGKQTSTPNVFLITADMISPDFISHPDPCLGSSIYLRSSRFCEAGCSFKRVLYLSTWCSFPRLLLTGRYSYVLGNGERAPEGLDSGLRPNDIIWPEYLQASGYVARHSGKGHLGTKKFIDAFGENDHPWNRWSPPIYVDDGYLDYQRHLGVKPQKYSREIVFLQQDRKTPGTPRADGLFRKTVSPFPSRRSTATISCNEHVAR
jgi:arylsulfatase A-like enzyme